jgi:hypothetical protein
MTALFINVCGVISLALAIYCCVPYIRSILKGKTKPHQFSWIIFAIMNGIIALSQFLAGGRLSVLVPATFFVINIVTIILSFKYGVRNTSRYDQLLFGLCLATIAAWALTKNNTLAIWLTVLIDIFATTMMILKVKIQPESEAIYPWALGSLAYIFSCLTLIDKPFGVLYVRPIYGLLSDFALVVAIYCFSKNQGLKIKSADNPSIN